MSTVHHHPQWPAIRNSQGLTRQRLPVYLDADNAPQYVLTVYHRDHIVQGFKIYQFKLLIEFWLKNQQENIQIFQEKTAVLNQLPNFRLVGEVSLEKDQVENINLFSKLILQKVIIGESAESTKRYGLKPEEQVKIFYQVTARAKALMDQMPKTLTMQNAPAVYQEVRTIADREKNKLYVESGYVKIHDSVNLTTDDRQFLKLHLSKATPHLNTLDCTGYAFLKTRETRAVGWITSMVTVNSSVEKSKFYEGNPIEFLQDWGYRVVDSPDTGDLVAYLQNASIFACAPKIFHTGIFQEDGTVLSKLSMREPEIWKHPLNAITADYGSLVLFFRKNSFNVQ